MRNVEHKNGAYVIDNKEVFLISGEFHYFRVEYKSWREKLVLLKQAGIMCVATYIPWLLHEPVEGVFDFDSKPYLRLEEFLKLCSELEIYVICRPGPYQYSEIRYGGLPYWLINNYPEIKAHDINGNPINMNSVSYIHPVFLEKSKKWFDTVCPIISRYTLENNGSVLYVQIDNELMGVHDWYGSWDYNKESMGFYSEDGLYPRFLESRYGTIDELNNAYDSEYSCFSEIFPVNSQISVSDLRRVKDYQDFYFYTVAKYAFSLTEWIKNAGINTDIVHNSASPYMNAFFEETVSHMGDGFLLGSDHYYNLSMDWDQNNPTPKYAVKSYVSLEMLKSMGMAPTVFEMPGGSCSDWPPITSKDLECCYMINTAFGMRGVNYYILTGGKNPENIGHTMDMYDYGAPISAIGELRDSYYMMKEYHEFLNNNIWLANSEIASDFAIVMDFNQSRCQFEKNKALTNGLGGLDMWSFIRKGIMITALCSSYTPEAVNIKAELPHNKPLVAPSYDCMSKASQEKIVNFVKDGGNILIGPCIPILDENYQPCTILRDFLGCSETRPYTKIPDSILRLNVLDIENVNISGKLFGMDIIPSDAEPIACEEVYKKNVGWMKKYNEGSVIWLGLMWMYQQKAHGRMFVEILKKLGVGEPAVSCNNPNIWAVKRVSSDREMIFAMNLFTSEMTAQIKSQNKDFGEISFPANTVKTLEV